MTSDPVPSLEEILSPGDWDSQVLKLPEPHFLQSSAWASFKAAYGWQARRYCISLDHEPMAYAAILVRRLGALRIAYVPRGPLMLEAGQRSLDAALAALEQLAREERFLFLKADPEIWDSDAEIWAGPTFRRRGWHRGTDVQFRNTVMMHIALDDQDILKRMKPKTRYNIRLAERRGVEVTPADADSLGEIYSLYRQTATRGGFIVRPRSYYELIWQHLVSNDMGTVLTARYDGQLLAAVVVVAYGKTAWYLHGASSSDHRNLMPNYILQWHAVRWARERGCTRYDMWGAPDSLDDSDPMWGVLRFKLGFGGHLRRGVGAWDYAPRRLAYQVYTRTAPLALSLGRAIRRRRQRYA